MMDQERGECGIGAARSRILADPCKRGKHPGVQPPGVRPIADIEMHLKPVPGAGKPICRLVESGKHGRGPPQSLAAGDLSDHEPHPDTRKDRDVNSDGNLTWRQARTAGHNLSGNAVPKVQRLRRGNRRAHNLPVRPLEHIDGYKARDFLEHDLTGEPGLEAREDKRGPDIGVAGERHLPCRRKDANPGGMGRVGRRQDEGCFGIIDFTGKALHLGIAQPRRTREDGQRVSAEALFGENIDGMVFVGGHA